MSHPHFSFDLNIAPAVEPQVQQEYVNPAQQRMDNITQALRTNQVSQAAELLREDSLYHPAEALRIAQNLQSMSQYGQIPESVTCGTDRWGRPDYQISSQFGNFDIHDGRVTEQQLAPPVPNYNDAARGPLADPCSDAPYAPGAQYSDSSYPSAGATYGDSTYTPTAPCDNTATAPSSYPDSYSSYDASPQVSFSFSFGNGGSFHDGRCNVPHGCGMPREIIVPVHHAPPHFAHRKFH
jgi:hypothetical protein